MRKTVRRDDPGSADGGGAGGRRRPLVRGRPDVGRFAPQDAGRGARPALAALRAGDPLGGHQVQGHVDGVGRVASVVPDGDGVRVRIEPPVELLRYCVEKGSVTVDGVSLTVAGVDETGLEVALIPHTLAETTLSLLASGDNVNLETDVLAKYVEKLLPGTMRP